MYERKIVNRRIEELRKAKGLTQPEFAEKLGIEGKKGRSTINNWETGGIQVKSDDLILISETFDVSTDWLLGREKKPTEVEAIFAASEITGLSKKAVKLLHCMNEADTNEEKRTLSFLNTVLSDPRFDSETDRLHETVFSLLDQYVKSGNVIRSVHDVSTAPETLEEFQRQETQREIEEKIIAVRSSDDMTEIVSVPEFYRAFKWNQIHSQIEYYREQEGKKNVQE